MNDEEIFDLVSSGAKIIGHKTCYTVLARHTEFGEIELYGDEDGRSNNDDKEMAEAILSLLKPGIGRIEAYQNPIFEELLRTRPEANEGAIIQVSRTA